MLKKSLLSTNFPFISQDALMTNYFKFLEANITIGKHPQARLNIKVLIMRRHIIFYVIK